MGVRDRLVSVRMPVTDARRHRFGMLVLVMLIVHVPVVVSDRLVEMFMLVALGEVKPDSQRHEQGGDHQNDRDRRPKNDREHRPEERRTGEIGTGAGRAHMPHRNDEEHEAHPVSEESDHHRDGDVDRGRQGGTESEGDDQVHRPGDPALDGRQPGGIRQRDLSSEIVVDPPAQAGAQDRQRWPDGAEIGTGRNAQHDGSRDDGRHAKSNAPIEILTEHEPGEQSGEDPLRVQQQGCAGGGHARETKHQQHRTEDASQPDSTGERQQFRLQDANPGASADEAEQPEPEPGPKIEQPCQQPRAHAVEQQFGNRCSRAKEDR